MAAAANRAFSGRRKFARFLLRKGKETAIKHQEKGEPRFGRQLQEKIVGIDGGGFARINVRRHRGLVVAQPHAQQRRRGDHAAGLQPVGEAQLERGQLPGFGKAQGRHRKKTRASTMSSGARYLILKTPETKR